MFLCDEAQRDYFSEEAQKANVELYGLDETLHAGAVFIPLDMDAIKRGEMYQQIINAIYSRIFGSIVEKLEAVAKSKVRNNLTERSQEAFIKLVDSMRAINILGDDAVIAKLNRIADLIRNNEIENLQKELSAEIKTIQARTKERVLQL
ncbi:Uncharacterised protein [uncultured archaeon]|nr:Uncharacterised protein [uncultured archaeon]